MDAVRKADGGWSSDILFSSTVGLPCDGLCRAPTGAPHRGNPNPPPHTQGPQGQVEYWKAQCGESRTLRLEQGKGASPTYQYDGCRKVTRNHRIFPSDEAVYKVLYLAMQNIAKQWTMPIRDWNPALNRFAIEFAGRFPQ
jgi:hypothetical protein